MSRKKKEKKEKKKRKIKLITILFILMDLFAISGFVITYGPWSYLRNLYVSTAMRTMNHQYLAKVFYSDEQIEEIMSQNYIVEVDEEVNLDDIVINTGEKQTYKDEYEEELLTREEGNDLYKVLNIKVGNANGYLVAIYQPEKVQLIRMQRFNYRGYGERVTDMCKRYGGLVCINGGGFTNGYDTGSDVPMGYVIDNNEIVWPSNSDGTAAGSIIGITNEGKLKLFYGPANEAIDSGMKYGVEFGPFLIVNGKPIEIVGMPYGVANKCVIAQRQDGIIMFLVTEGETYIDGASLKDVVKTLEKYGAYNAANLDGGQSTSLVVKDKLINSPNYLAKKQGGRTVVTGWGLIP